jgi:periplasmic divalent cation tolerance protein
MKEAESITRELLSKHLIACANIIESRSIYKWKGKMKNSKECILLMKSMQKAYKEIEKKVKEMHSYECPCVLQITVSRSVGEYYQWIRNSVILH